MTRSQYIFTLHVCHNIPSIVGIALAMFTSVKPFSALKSMFFLLMHFHIPYIHQRILAHHIRCSFFLCITLRRHHLPWRSSPASSRRLIPPSSIYCKAEGFALDIQAWEAVQLQLILREDEKEHTDFLTSWHSAHLTFVVQH